MVKNRAKSKRALLQRLWYNPDSEASFGGVRRLYIIAKVQNHDITVADVRKFLESQLTYQLFRKRVTKISRNRFTTPGPAISISIDLWSLQTYGSQNNGYLYVLMAIDNFSRKAVGVPIKKKNTPEIIRALKCVFEVLPAKVVISDREGSVVGTKVRSFFKANNVHLMHNLNSGKAVLVEKLIGTLSIRLARAMKAAGDTWEWFSNGLLGKLIKSYNASKHSSLLNGKYCPNEINELNSYKVYDYMVRNRPPGMRAKISANKQTLKLGDKVTISVEPSKFDKQLYVPKYKPQVYLVHKVNKAAPRVTYTIKSMADGTVMEGSFYREELGRVQGNGRLQKGPGKKLF